MLTFEMTAPFATCITNRCQLRELDELMKKNPVEASVFD